MAFPQSTVKLLEELESTSNIKHLRGFQAELIVIRYYLGKGYSLRSHRKKYFHTEIDLVMESSQKVILIEVKYTTHIDYLSVRMSLSQKKRLESVYLRYIESTPKDVEFHYVIVDQKGKLEIFDEFLA